MKWQVGDYARIKEGNGLYSNQPCVVVDAPSALWPRTHTHVDIYVLSGMHRGSLTACHEDNLVLVPPAFTSPAEADAWLDANAR